MKDNFPGHLNLYRLRANFNFAVFLAEYTFDPVQFISLLSHRDTLIDSYLVLERVLTKIRMLSIYIYECVSCRV